MPKTQSIPPPPELPSVETLGRYLAALERGYEALDSRSAAMTDGQKLNCEPQMILLFERGEAIRNLILTMRPQTLADAAVTAHIGGKCAAGLRGFDMDQRERDGAALAIERAFFAIVPIIAAAAGLDVQAMDFADDAELADVRFSGLEAIA